MYAPELALNSKQGQHFPYRALGCCVALGKSCNETFYPSAAVYSSPTWLPRLVKHVPCGHCFPSSWSWVHLDCSVLDRKPYPKANQSANSKPCLRATQAIGGMRGHMGLWRTQKIRGGVNGPRRQVFPLPIAATKGDMAAIFTGWRCLTSIWSIGCSNSSHGCTSTPRTRPFMCIYGGTHPPIPTSSHPHRHGCTSCTGCSWRRRAIHNTPSIEISIWFASI